MNTYNFCMEPYSYSYPLVAKGSFRDMRNGIVCINPSLDIECYLNYLSLLSDMKNSWKSNGYLHLGMMPVVMGPSFMQRGLTDLICKYLNDKNVKYYSMPPVSLLYDKCKLPDNDIWMFREDAAKMMGKSNVTAEQFLRWCVL